MICDSRAPSLLRLAHAAGAAARVVAVCEQVQDPEVTENLDRARRLTSQVCDLIGRLDTGIAACRPKLARPNPAHRGTEAQGLESSRALDARTPP